MHNMLIFKVKTDATGVGHVSRKDDNNIDLTWQALWHKTADQLINPATDWVHDYYYIAVFKEDDAIQMVCNLKSVNGVLETTQVHWQDTGKYNYHPTTENPDPDWIRCTVK